jgi:hypothetical protein
LALLNHILTVVEWLKTEDFNYTHSHADGGVL